MTSRELSERHFQDLILNNRVEDLKAIIKHASQSMLANALFIRNASGGIVTMIINHLNDDGYDILASQSIDEDALYSRLEDIQELNIADSTKSKFMSRLLLACTRTKNDSLWGRITFELDHSIDEPDLFFLENELVTLREYEKLHDIIVSQLAVRDKLKYILQRGYDEMDHDDYSDLANTVINPGEENEEYIFPASQNDVIYIASMGFHDHILSILGHLFVESTYLANALVPAVKSGSLWTVEVVLEHAENISPKIMKEAISEAKDQRIRNKLIEYKRRRR